MISVNQLNFEYGDGHKALTNISLKVEKGCKLAVVGANGAGKSTLLSLIAGIHSIKSGSILLNGIVLNKENLETIRRKTGFVFQNPDDQLFMPRVFEDIAFGPKNFGFSTEEADEMAVAAMKLLRIEYLKDRAPHRMSGGEKRSVALAAVLAMKPEILLLDEPTSFLDPKSRRNIIKVLSQLNQTMVIATHDLDMALDLCNRVVVLNRGQIAADGDPQEILYNEKLLDDSGLELPLSLQR